MEITQTETTWFPLKTKKKKYLIKIHIAHQCLSSDKKNLCHLHL